MAGAPFSQQRWKMTRWIAGGILFGTACFLAGRLSTGLPHSTAEPKTAAIAVTNATPVVPANSETAPRLASVKPQPRLSSTSTMAWDAQQWQTLMSQPATSARNAALAAMLEKLAAADPIRAMGLAQEQKNLRLREGLVHAALRGWASSAPADAANWALALPNQSERSHAIETIFASAVALSPDEAVRVAAQILEREPGGSGGYGCSLIDALCEAGHFDTAAQFAASGKGGDREAFLGEAYSKWASLQPEAAAATAAALTDPDIRNQALHGVVGGWAEADPAALTEFLGQLPPGGERGPMLGQALESWVRLDPTAAAAWINNTEMSPDLDAGVKAVASMDLDSGLLKPEAAVSWAESILNEKLRSEALADVLREWARLDPKAAQDFLKTTTHLQPNDRQQVTEILNDLSQTADTP
jgi:hypothetical protein